MRAGDARRQDIPGISACFNDEIVVDFSNSEGPFAGIYSGRDAVIRFCRSYGRRGTRSPLPFIECGDECLVTADAPCAKGRASGISVEAHVANLWSFRDGRVSRCTLFQTTDEALEAAGVSRS